MSDYKKWYFGGVRYIATGKKADYEQIIARLNPLGGGTTHQVFGWDDEIVNLEGVVVGDTDIAALEAMRATGTRYSLTFDGVSVGSYYLKKLSYTRKPIWKHTLSDNPDDPVYWCTMELLDD